MRLIIILDRQFPLSKEALKRLEKAACDIEVETVEFDSENTSHKAWQNFIHFVNQGEKPVIFDARFTSTYTAQVLVALSVCMYKEFLTNATSGALRTISQSQPIVFSLAPLGGVLTPINNETIYSGGVFSRVISDFDSENSIFFFDLFSVLRSPASGSQLTAVTTSDAALQTALTTDFIAEIDDSRVPLTFRNQNPQQALAVNDVLLFQVGTLYPGARIFLEGNRFRVVDGQGTLLTYYQLPKFPEGYFNAAGWVREEGGSYRFDTSEVIVLAVERYLKSKE